MSRRNGRHLRRIVRRRVPPPHDMEIRSQQDQVAAVHFTRRIAVDCQDLEWRSVRPHRIFETVVFVPVRPSRSSV